MESRIEQLKEYARILKDAPYALKTYLQTYDNTQKKYVPLELFPDQVQLIQDYEDYNENITRKYRQAGVSTVTSAWISRRLQLAKPENPERVLVIANKRDTAIEMANKIRHFLEQWPDWLNVGFSPDKNSESRFRLNNGCEVKAVATSPDALRGYTPTILVFDEAAYIEAGEDFWAASMASLSTGGKIILISTPNGYDPIYYGVYDQAIRKMNDFHITDLRWFKDPRYTKDLRWIKCSDITHYMLNREQYDDNEVVMYEFDIEKYNEYLDEGYKPFSSWFESMSKKFKYDRRKIAQELECDFLGSGDGVIPGDVQDNITKNMLREPKEKYMQGTFWQWKEPIVGHRYIMGVDVSRGDSEDFSSINIVDFDEINNKRTQIVAAFEEQLRKGFAVRSARLMNELNTFVYINGRPDHMKGAHDDSIMSLSMALYAGDMCFSQLQKNENANKAMLESWTVSERTYEANKTFYAYGSTMDSIGAMQMNGGNNNHPLGSPTKDHYKEYSWLFSRRK